MAKSDWEDVKVVRQDSESDWEDINNEEIYEAETTSGLESALRGAAQGVTLGFADEISGGLESAFSDKTYEQARDESRGNFKKAKEDNPGLYMTGEIGGGVATALVPIGTAATLTRAAAMGAGMGGLAGLGSSEAEDLKGLAIDTTKGAGLGLAGGALGYGASKAIPWAAKSAGEKLKAIAEMRAVKALGGSKKAMENLKASRTKDFIPESRLGRNLLDDGVVTPLASKEKMAERLAKLEAKKVASLSDELDMVSGLQSKVKVEDALRLENAKFRPVDAANELKAKMAQEYNFVPQKIRDKQGEIVDEWLSNPERMDIKDAQAFKTQMQKWIKDPSYFNANPGVAQETLKGIRSQIKTGIERNADEAASILGEQGGKIKSINQDLGGIYQGADMLEDAIARGSKNRTFSLTDYIGANAGAAAAGPKGLALGVANKLVREKGSQVTAVALDRASKFLLRSPRMQQLASTNPPAFKALASSLAQRSSTSSLPKVAEESESPEYVSSPMSDEAARRKFLEN